MMRFAKILSLVAGIAVLAFAAGCTSEGNKPSGGSGELIRIAVINNDPNESGYRTANDRDLRATFCAENGFDADFSYSLRNEEQINYARKYIQDEVDYLLLSAADTSGWEPVLKDAKTAGVRVILFDRIIDADESLYDASVVSDMLKEGEMAVNWLKDQKFTDYSILHIQGIIGSAPQKGRSQALESAADEYGWNIVAQQTAEWSAEKAQQIVQAAIDSNKKFNVIYAENDDMAKGAAAALDKANISHGAGKDVAIISFDCNKWAMEQVLAGNWNYDGQCDPYQASYILDIINTLESGGTLSKKKVYIEEKGFDAASITQEDIEKYGI